LIVLIVLSLVFLILNDIFTFPTSYRITLFLFLIVWFIIIFDFVIVLILLIESVWFSNVSAI